MSLFSSCGAGDGGKDTADTSVPDTGTSPVTTVSEDPVAGYVKDTEISYVDAVHALIDLDLAARLPDAGDTGAAATSYDRNSYYDAENDIYVNWGDATPYSVYGDSKSNADGSGFIEKYDDGSVLAADIKGRGVIVRSFFATVGSGYIEIYVDGRRSPVVSMPLKDYVEPKGKYEGLDNLVYTTEALGCVNYVPVTFNESCRIVLRKGWGKYFHFSYRLFGDNVKVEPLKSRFSDEQRQALNEVNALLSDPGAYTGPAGKGKTVSSDHDIPEGTEKTVYSADGTGAVSRFRVRVNGKYPDLDWFTLMQKIEISMYWDVEEDPSVWAPLGDFFANSGGQIYATVPMGMTGDGWFYSNFLMPYRSGARIVIKNGSSYDVNISVETTAGTVSGIDTLGRFHAKFSMGIDPGREDRKLDYVFLRTAGRGRFVGFNLHVLNSVGKNAVHWWGEGDELFFVDGEKFPSTHGTGSEDYFGYAWCRGDYFTRAFHAQNWTTTLRGAPGDYNNVRFQLLDGIGFQNGFEGAIEKTWSNDDTVYTSVAFWYLDENGTDPMKPQNYEGEAAVMRYLSLEKLREKETRQASVNVIEAEEMRIKEHRGMTLKMQSLYLTSEIYSNRRALAWGGTDGVVPDDAYMVLEFDLREDYSGTLMGYFAKGKASGTYRFIIDGVTVGEVMLYNKNVTRIRTPLMKIGDVDLKAGRHEMRIEVVPSESEGNVLVFDCLVFGDGIKTK